ncbi:MAG: hypothetical protein JJU36_10215 [Phycisphaeraceae bacterium]|nr:hypothetical protein [Phycisphaeraceae bacterium]
MRKYLRVPQVGFVAVAVVLTLVWAGGCGGDDRDQNGSRSQDEGGAPPMVLGDEGQRQTQRAHPGLNSSPDSGQRDIREAQAPSAVGQPHDTMRPMYSSPSEVIDAAHAALRREDFNAYVNCMTPAFELELLGQLISLACQQATAELPRYDGAALHRYQAARDATRQFLSARGIDDPASVHDEHAALRQRMVDEDARPEQVLASWIDQITEDPRGLLIDLLRHRGESAFINAAEWEMTTENIRIRDDEATGTVRMKHVTIRQDDMLRRVRFEKIDDGWLLAQDFMF